MPGICGFQVILAATKRAKFDLSSTNSCRIGLFCHAMCSVAGVGLLGISNISLIQSDFCFETIPFDIVLAILPNSEVVIRNNETPSIVI